MGLTTKMAIIRKGDKKAEEGLRQQAEKQSKQRAMSSQNQLESAGLSDRLVHIDTKTGRAHTLTLGAPGNAFKLSSVQFSGPISGSSSQEWKESQKNSVKESGSGVIKAGKVVKGNATTKRIAKAQGKKRD